VKTATRHLNAELRIAALYAAVISTLCVVLLNVLVTRHGGNHSLLFGTWLDQALQTVSGGWVAIIITAPVVVVALRLLLSTRIFAATVALLCWASATASVMMLVMMLQD